jgi:hypothetical protein
MSDNPEDTDRDNGPLPDVLAAYLITRSVGAWLTAKCSWVVANTPILVSGLNNPNLDTVGEAQKASWIGMSIVRAADLAFESLNDPDLTALAVKFLTENNPAILNGVEKWLARVVKDWNPTVCYIPADADVALEIISRLIEVRKEFFAENFGAELIEEESTEPATGETATPEEVIAKELRALGIK